MLGPILALIFAARVDNAWETVRGLGPSPSSYIRHFIRCIAPNVKGLPFGRVIPRAFKAAIVSSTPSMPLLCSSEIMAANFSSELVERPTPRFGQWCCRCRRWAVNYDWHRETFLCWCAERCNPLIEPRTTNACISPPGAPPVLIQGDDCGEGSLSRAPCPPSTKDVAAEGRSASACAWCFRHTPCQRELFQSG